MESWRNHHDALVLRELRLSSRTWNPITSPWMKQLTWLRIVHSGDWCLRLALRSPSGASPEKKKKKKKSVKTRTEKQHLTKKTLSHNPLMLLLAVSVYDPLTWIVSLFLAADLACTAVGLFIRQSGTRCQMNLEILTVLTALNDSWRQFSSAVTSVTSALKFF